MEELDGDTPCRAIYDLVHDKEMTRRRRSSSGLPPVLAEVDREGTTSLSIQAELHDRVVALLNAERGSLCRRTQHVGRTTTRHKSRGFNHGKDTSPAYETRNVSSLIRSESFRQYRLAEKVALVVGSPLSGELAEIGDRGFSSNLEELSIELKCMAVPLLDPTDPPILPINVVLTRHTSTEEFEEEYPPPVMTAANEISERATYRDLPISRGVHGRPASKDRT